MCLLLDVRGVSRKVIFGVLRNPNSNFSHIPKPNRSWIWVIAHRGSIYTQLSCIKKHRYIQTCPWIPKSDLWSRKISRLNAVLDPWSNRILWWSLTVDLGSHCILGNFWDWILDPIGSLMELVVSDLWSINPRPAGGGAKGPPCGFSQIAPEVLGISLWNLSYLSGQQFHTLCQKLGPRS